MKTIGIIGGMSWESTAVYFRLLNEGVRDRLGGLHSARLRVATVDFADVAELQQRGDWDAAGELLVREARGLEAAGAELLLIATNTMHIVFDRIAAAVSIPVLHLADVTADAVRSHALTRVGLIATRYTMEQRFYRDRLAAAGIETIVPDVDDRAEVQRIIFDELCLGEVTDRSRAALSVIAQKLLAQGAEGIVLGCTELELSVGQSDIAALVFPTTTLHCAAALAAALPATT